MKKLFTCILLLCALGSFAQVSNPGVEDWHNYSANGEPLTAPDDWYGSDEATFWADTNQLIGILITPVKMVYKSTTKHSGTYGARIESHQIANFGSNIQSGALSTAHMSYAAIYVMDGGTPVTEQISYVYAWAKYTAGPGGDDTGSIVVTAIMPGSNGDSIVGYGANDILPSSNYQQIGTLVEYTDANVVPTHLQITFYSSKGIVSGQEDSQLWIDDVSWSTASAKNVTNTKVVKVYPNPSSGVVSVFNTTNEPVTIKAFNMSGQQVAEKKFTGNNFIDLTAQASGLYFYNIVDSEGRTVQHGKLTIAK